MFKKPGLTMSVSFWQKDNIGASVSCDVAIVGGGIIGTATAFWLKKEHPHLHVVVLEAQQVGYGASGRNAGFILQGASSDYATDCERLGKERAAWLWDFTLENRNLLETELDANQFAFTSSGSLLLAGSEEEYLRLKKSQALLHAEGQSSTLFSAHQIESRIAARGFFGGLLIPTGGMLHSAKLLMHLAGHSGAQILEHHKVESFESSADCIILQTPLRNIRAEKVLLALNAYLPLLVPELSKMVSPVRAQMLATHPLDAVVLPEPVYSHDGYYYIRQDRSGSLLLGGARHLYPEEEVGFHDTTTFHLQKALLDYMYDHFPWSAGVTVEREWSGVMGFAPDHLPLVGRLPDEDRVLWSAGFTGHGMGYGFRFGKMLSRWLMKGPSMEEKSFFGVGRLNRD